MPDQRLRNSKLRYAVFTVDKKDDFDSQGKDHYRIIDEIMNLNDVLNIYLSCIFSIFEYVHIGGQRRRFLTGVVLAFAVRGILTRDVNLKSSIQYGESFGKRFRFPHTAVLRSCETEPESEIRRTEGLILLTDTDNRLVIHI